MSLPIAPVAGAAAEELVDGGGVVAVAEGFALCVAEGAGLLLVAGAELEPPVVLDSPPQAVSAKVRARAAADRRRFPFMAPRFAPPAARSHARSHSIASRTGSRPRASRHVETVKITWSFSFAARAKNAGRPSNEATR